MLGINIRPLGIDTPSGKTMLERFLADFDLTVDRDIEECLGLYAGNSLIGTCCRAGKVLKCFAVREEYQSLDLSSRLMSAMLARHFSLGIRTSFVFTTPRNRSRFESMGFRHLVSGSEVVLLEFGTTGIREYQANLEQIRSQSTVNGCIVMNCNPFTLGHRYLIERARAACEVLYIILVQEDRSLFPFEVRKRLVMQGTADLDGIHLVDGGNYVISSATFPHYFLKQDGEAAQNEAELDINLFCQYIAPALGIVKRFAGTEPLDPLTSTYNRVMEKALPAGGIEFIEFERKLTGSIPISASEVRRRIRRGDAAGMEDLLPESTIAFLYSPESERVRARIMESSAAG